MPTQVTIAGETYSANLGDGVIADCIAHLFGLTSPDIVVVHTDISGLIERRQADETPQPGEQPRPPRFPRRNNWLRWHLVRRRRGLAAWRPRLAGASALVVGGGQLLMDNNLDFPLKINAIVREATQQGVPVHFLSCGVNPNWSPDATRLFGEALGAARSVSVRDTASAEALRRLVPGIEVGIAADPAIWTAQVYGVSNDRPARPTVGLGVMGASAVNRRLKQAVSDQRLIELWTEIIATVHRRGQAVELFTNGSPEDHVAAMALSQHVAAALGIDCPIAPRPRQPAELAHLISRYAAVVAMRLHSTIITTSYLIPVVGMSWDSKVKAFFAQTGRSSLALDLATADAQAVVAALDEAVAMGIDAGAIQVGRDSALRGVETIVRQITA